MALPVKKTRAYGRSTATAGTAITQLIDPVQGARAVITTLKYTAGTTAHTLHVMQPFNTTTLSASAAGGQAVISLTADPGLYTGKSTANNAIAASDNVVIEKPDGTFHHGVVSSVSSLDITLTANVPTNGFANAAKVWFFGIQTDTNPNTAQVNPTFTGTASATTTLTDEHGIAGAISKYEPLIVRSDNTTAAGTIEGISVAYSAK